MSCELLKLYKCVMLGLVVANTGCCMKEPVRWCNNKIEFKMEQFSVHQRCTSSSTGLSARYQATMSLSS